MTERDLTGDVVSAYEAGDHALVFRLALEYAKELHVAAALKASDARRRAMQAERTRASRERRRNVTSRDDTLHSVTSHDTNENKDIKALSTKSSSSSRSRSRTAPFSGVSWVTRLHGVWTSLAGTVQIGQVGAQLKPHVDSRGENVVEQAMRLYVATKQASGDKINFGWFAGDCVQWMNRVGKLGVVDGEMTPELELLTRPNGVRL